MDSRAHGRKNRPQGHHSTPPELGDTIPRTRETCQCKPERPSLAPQTHIQEALILGSWVWVWGARDRRSGLHWQVSYRAQEELSDALGFIARSASYVRGWPQIELSVCLSVCVRKIINFAEG